MSEVVIPNGLGYLDNLGPGYFPYVGEHVRYARQQMALEGGPVEINY